MTLRVLCLVATLALTGCVTSGALVSGAAILDAAGYSLDAYCRLTPEGRAAIRKRLHIRAQLIACAP